MASAGVVLGSVAAFENLHQSLTGHTRHSVRHGTNLQVTPLRPDFAEACVTNMEGASHVGEAF